MKKLFFISILIYSGVFCFLNETYWKPNDSDKLKSERDIRNVINGAARQNPVVKFNTIADKKITNTYGNILPLY